MAVTKEQQRALALARARRAKAEAQKSKVPEGFKQYVPEPAKDPLTAGEYAQSYLDALARGATFGALDEIQGVASGLVGMAFGKDFTEGYEEGRDKSRARAERFRDEAPVMAYGSEIAGSIVPSLALAPLAGASRAKQAGLALTEGATAGALSAEGDLQDRAVGGAVGGLLGGTLGGAAAVLPKSKDAAKSLLEAGVDLTAGQRVGGGAGLVENVTGKTIAGDIMGIGDAQKRSYETFSKAFIDKSLDNIGYKTPKDLSVRDSVDDANTFVSKFFKNAVNKTSIGKKTVDKLETSILEKFYDKEKLMELGVDPEGADEFLSLLDKYILDKAKKGTLTGKEVADSLSDLGAKATSMTADESADRNVAQLLFEVQSEIVEALPQSVDGKSLQDARNAYRAMIAVNKAAKGRAKDAFTPAQAERALEAVYKSGAKETPQGILARKGKEVMPSATVPSGEKGAFGSAISLAQILGLGAGGLPVLPATAAGLGAGAGVYRTGRVGSDIATGLLQAPRYPFEALSRTPALSGLLAERMTEE